MHYFDALLFLIIMIILIIQYYYLYLIVIVNYTQLTHGLHTADSCILTTCDHTRIAGVQVPGNWFHPSLT